MNIKKLGFSLLILCLTYALCFGQKLTTGAPGATAPKAGEKVAVIDTNFGRIIFKFFPKLAPKTVESFQKLTKQGYFDGVTFHRAVPGFMIQGGDPNTKPGATGQPGTGGPGYTLPDEFSNTHHARGMVSMANTGQPQSSGSQFFVMVGDAGFLDGKYSLFGQVVQGMNVADKIVALPTQGEMLAPRAAVMKKVRIMKWPVKG